MSAPKIQNCSDYRIAPVRLTAFARLSKKYLRIRQRACWSYRDSLRPIFLEAHPQRLHSKRRKRPAQKKPIRGRKIGVNVSDDEQTRKPRVYLGKPDLVGFYPVPFRLAGPGQGP